MRLFSWAPGSRITRADGLAWPLSLCHAGDPLQVSVPHKRSSEQLARRGLRCRGGARARGLAPGWKTQSCVSRHLVGSWDPFLLWQRGWPAGVVTGRCGEFQRQLAREMHFLCVPWVPLPPSSHDTKRGWFQRLPSSPVPELWRWLSG